MASLAIFITVEVLTTTRTKDVRGLVFNQSRSERSNEITKCRAYPLHDNWAVIFCWQKCIHGHLHYWDVSEGNSTWFRLASVYLPKRSMELAGFRSSSIVVSTSVYDLMYLRNLLPFLFARNVFKLSLYKSFFMKPLLPILLPEEIRVKPKRRVQMFFNFDSI